MPTLKSVNDIHKRKELYVKTKLKSLSNEVDILQKDLLSLIIEDFEGKLQLDASGNIIQNIKNITLTNELDQVFKKFETVFHKDNLAGFGKDLLKLQVFNKTYYEGLDIEATTLNRIIQKQTFIKKRINLYLNELLPMPEVRLKVKNYVLSAISEGQTYNNYLTGMKQLLEGTAEGKGLLQKYYTTFVYDTYNEVDAVMNEHFAENLGLRFFVYTGSVIATSRRFCIIRAGKVYEISETNKWKCDPTLIGKPKGVKCDASYNYTQRGRYRCRHYIRFITNDLAIRMRPGIKQKFNLN